MQRAPRHAALVIGASGGIGSALVTHFLANDDIDAVIAVSRNPTPPGHIPASDRLLWIQCAYDDDGIAHCSDRLRPYADALSYIVITCGLLHTPTLTPEKTLEQVHSDPLLQVLHANLVVPAMWLSTLASLFKRSTDCVIAVLSARVGSIEDNGLGGWYSYRSSKAGLNMFLKTAAIELARRAPGVKLIAFHPGTTDTSLSKPFQRNVPPGRLFSPAFVAERLAGIMHNAPRDQALAYLDWDAQSIPW